MHPGITESPRPLTVDDYRLTGGQEGALGGCTSGEPEHEGRESQLHGGQERAAIDEDRRKLEGGVRNSRRLARGLLPHPRCRRTPAKARASQLAQVITIPEILLLPVAPALPLLVAHQLQNNVSQDCFRLEIYRVSTTDRLRGTDTQGEMSRVSPVATSAHSLLN